jgi:hypothetical protein
MALWSCREIRYGRNHDSRIVLPLLQDLAAASLNPIHLIRKGKPSLREQRKTFLQGWFAG